MISLVQLEYIVALDTYKSFSVAADRCFVTQPTLSMQIKKMETDLGIIIFDRSKQPVVPTEIGRMIVQQARLVISESKKIDELIQWSKNSLSGELKIGIIPSLAPYLLPLFIGEFTRKHPGIKVSIRELLTTEICDSVKAELIDVGILVTPLDLPGFNLNILFYEQIMLYCNKNHELASWPEIKISQIKQEKLWILSQGHCFRNQAINLCNLKDEKNTLPFKYESASIDTLMKFVDMEGGLTLIPELACNDLPESRRKNAKLIKDVKPIREVSIITSKLFVKQRILKALQDDILSAIPAEMKDKNRGEIVEWK